MFLQQQTQTAAVTSHVYSTGADYIDGDGGFTLYVCADFSNGRTQLLINNNTNTSPERASRAERNCNAHPPRAARWCLCIHSDAVSPYIKLNLG